MRWLVLTLILAGCRTSQVHDGAPWRGERRDPPCLPFTTRRPVPVDGGVCGDGLAGGPCEELETHSCHAEQRGTERVCHPYAETCDGPDLRGSTCESVGLSGMGLRCLPGCNDFDSSRCDRCPRRPGVRCVELPLPSDTFAFRTLEAPSGDVAILGITEGRVAFHLKPRLGPARQVKARHGFDPREFTVAGADVFLAAGALPDGQFVVAPVSVRDGLGEVRGVPLPPGSTMASLVTVNGVAWLLTRAPSSRVVAMVPLDAKASVLAMPHDVPVVAGAIAGVGGPAGTTIVELRQEPPGYPQFGCELEATLADGGAARGRFVEGAPVLDLGPLGQVRATRTDAGCDARWELRGSISRLTTASSPPPRMHGVDGWSRTTVGWVGHRQGLLLFVSDDAGVR